MICIKNIKKSESLKKVREKSRNNIIIKEQNMYIFPISAKSLGIWKKLRGGVEFMGFCPRKSLTPPYVEFYLE